MSGIKPNFQRKTLLPGGYRNAIFKNKSVNKNLRETLMAGNDVNGMKRISITNFNKSINVNKILWKRM